MKPENDLTRWERHLMYCSYCQNVVHGRNCKDHEKIAKKCCAIGSRLYIPFVNYIVKRYGDDS